jgi:hypothetical protein
VRDRLFGRGRPSSRGVDRLSTGLLVAAVLGYSWVASGTEPFTVAAEATTAIPIGALIAAALVQRRMADGGLIGRRSPGGDPVTVLWQDRAGRAGIVTWGVLACLVVGWELFNYFHANRYRHPTLSSFLDTVSTHHASKAVLYLAWLLGGWYLLRR